MNEKLELMARIYELSRVEPEYFEAAFPSTDRWGLYHISTLLNKEALKNPDIFPHCSCYYPLEQCLRELPYMIRVDGTPTYLEVHKDNEKLISFYFQYGGVRYIEATDKDAHTAALKLWIKVLEENQ